jgi:hypothetical protein
VGGHLEREFCGTISTFCLSLDCRRGQLEVFIEAHWKGLFGYRGKGEMSVRVEGWYLFFTYSGSIRS